MKSSLKTTIQTYDQIALNYVKKTQDFAPIPELNKFSKLLEKGAKVLDAGCGWGRDAKILAEKFEVTGIDLSTKLLEYAKSYCLKCHFLKRDILESKFDSDCFDGLWSNVALLHLEREDVSTALAEFYRILKKGGIAFISVKTGEGEEVKSEDLSGNNPRFFTWFSEEEFKKYCLEAGFNVLEFYVTYEQDRIKLNRNLGVINCFLKK